MRHAGVCSLASNCIELAVDDQSSAHTTTVLGQRGDGSVGVGGTPAVGADSIDLDSVEAERRDIGAITDGRMERGE